jgi:hypothetical protein
MTSLVHTRVSLMQRWRVHHDTFPTLRGPLPVCVPTDVGDCYFILLPFTCRGCWSSIDMNCCGEARCSWMQMLEVVEWHARTESWVFMPCNAQVRCMFRVIRTVVAAWSGWNKGSS